MGLQEDEFVAKALRGVTIENFEDVTGVWAGQNKVKFDLSKDASEEIQQYIEQGV